MWLYCNLQYRPGIWMLPIKELYYFDAMVSKTSLLLLKMTNRGKDDAFWTGEHFVVCLACCYLDGTEVLAIKCGGYATFQMHCTWSISGQPLRTEGTACSLWKSGLWRGWPGVWTIRGRLTARFSPR